MRASSTVVVLSSLVIASAVAVAAGPNDKKVPPPKAGSGSSTGSAAGSGSAVPAAGSGSNAGSAAPQIDPASVPPADMPTAVRLRRLEQRTQALKERAWQLKARVESLKEQVIGAGSGAQAVIAHASEMGSSFRLIKLVYQLDGTQIFARTDDSAEELYKTKAFDVFAGPISPGNHTLVAVATYRGHGYGVFEYLSHYTFTANDQQSFSVLEGKQVKIDCRGFETGGANTPLEKRSALECKITQSAPLKDGGSATPLTAPAPTPATTTPSTTPPPAEK